MTPSTDAEWREYFERLSLTDLRDAARHVAREEFPDRAAMIDAEIARRTAYGPTRETMDAHWRAQFEPVRFWRRMVFVIYAAYLPAGIVIGFPLCRAFHSSAPIFLVFLATVALLLYSLRRALFFRCPRCGEDWALSRSDWRVVQPRWWPHRCGHCGLEI